MQHDKDNAQEGHEFKCSSTFVSIFTNSMQGRVSACDTCRQVLVRARIRLLVA